MLLATLAPPCAQVQRQAAPTQACNSRQPMAAHLQCGSSGTQRNSRARGGTASPPPAAAPATGSASATQQPLERQQERTALLDWLVACRGATPACPKVERRNAGELGWALVATADIEADEVILSVPLTAAITSEGVDESRWSTHMASELLDQQQAAAVAVAADGDTQAASQSIQPWLDVLPAAVDLPWLYWSAGELAELQDEDTLAEARHLRGVYEAASEELAGRYTRQQVAWALSLVHSRSFAMQGSHVWVPGIDLCNHTLQPNAGIRCVHSPGSCQGAAALEEVAPPATAAAQAAEPSRFELVAGEEGVAAGEEVTISYGDWPNDVFLLFFSFCPSDNPHNSAALFYDLFELKTFHQRLAALPAAGEEGEEGCGAEVDAAVQQLEEQLGAPQEAFLRMVATANGIDSRLLQAAEALLAAGRGSKSGREYMTLPAFLEARCHQLLEAYPTSIAEDKALLQQLEEGQLGEGTSRDGGGSACRPEQLQAAVRYRLGKKRVLQATLESVQ